MRDGADPVVLAPSDVLGFLAASAALRRYGDAVQVQFLAPHELSRRLAGLADEPDPPPVVVVDLLPTDSIDSLLLPALETLSGRNRRVAWIYGRPEPAPLLYAIAEVIDLSYSEGAASWTMLAERDESFLRLASEIVDPSSADSNWRMILRALAASWDWARTYRCVASLASLAAPDEDDASWARKHLAEAERAEALVASAPRRLFSGRNVVVVSDPSITARLRPEIFREVRQDADVLAFLAGPGRLVILAAQADVDLTFLRAPDLEQAVVAGSLRGPRADVAWPPGEAPETVVALVGEHAVDEVASLPGADVARVDHVRARRFAKGLHPDKLSAADLSVIKQGLQGS